MRRKSIVLPGLLVAVAAVCNLSSVAIAASYVLQPPESTSEDVFGYEGFPAFNFDNFPAGPGVNFGNILAVSNTGEFGGHSVKTLVRFDLSGTGIVDSSLVSDATLKLWVVDGSTLGFPIANPTPATPVTLDAFTATSAWEETKVTWNTLPSIGATPVDTVVVDAIGQWVQFDVKSSVIDWLDTPASNLGLLLSSPAVVPVGKGAAGVVFLSSTTSAMFDSESLKPQLVINTVPEPSTAVLALVGLGCAALFGRRRICRRLAGNQF